MRIEIEATKSKCFWLRQIGGKWSDYVERIGSHKTKSFQHTFYSAIGNPSGGRVVYEVANTIGRRDYWLSVTYTEVSNVA